MTDFNDKWTRIKRSVVSFVEALEGTSHYPFERIDQLQRELALVQATRQAPCETCRTEPQP